MKLEGYASLKETFGKIGAILGLCISSMSFLAFSKENILLTFGLKQNLIILACTIICGVIGVIIGHHLDKKED